MSSSKEDHFGSLRATLDRVLEAASNEGMSSFRAMAEAANLDPNRDFIGVSLRDMDFRDEDLRGFNFSNADLTRADFRRANVDGVLFQGAKLKGAVGLPGLAESLPHVTANLIAGVIETIAAEPHNGNADLTALADELHLEAEELVPITISLRTLGFAEISGEHIRLTSGGRRFSISELDFRKRIFREHLMGLPLVHRILSALRDNPYTGVPFDVMLHELEHHMSNEAEQALQCVISWDSLPKCLLMTTILKCYISFSSREAFFVAYRTPIK